MVDLSGIKHIYIFPGITDMRLGIYGLRKRLLESEGEIRADSIYLFCGKSKNQIKMIQTNEQSIWLYQNKLVKGRFAWPEKGEKTDLSNEQLLMILNCMSLISEIENKGEKYSMY